MVEQKGEGEVKRGWSRQVDVWWRETRDEVALRGVVGGRSGEWDGGGSTGRGGVASDRG